MRQIIDKVDDVSPIFYRHLATAEKDNSRYPDALRHAAESIRLARGRRDLLEEAIGHRIMAVTSARIGDYGRMRAHFHENRRIAKSNLKGAVGAGLRNEVVTMLGHWARYEDTLGRCQAGRSLLEDALKYAQGSVPEVRPGWLKNVRTRQKEHATRCPASSGAGPPA